MADTQKAQKMFKLLPVSRYYNFYKFYQKWYLSSGDAHKIESGREIIILSCQIVPVTFRAYLFYIGMWIRKAFSLVGLFISLGLHIMKLFR